MISPLLANIYLHYVYDLWADQWRKREATGEVIVVRYADDTIVGFERQADAERFLRDLRERLVKFGLALHPDKTRLIEFGRYAAQRRSARGWRSPETFDFLGFTHICGKAKEGRRLRVAGAQGDGQPKMVTKPFQKMMFVTALLMVGAASAQAQTNDYSQLAKSAGLTTEQAAGMTLDEIAEAKRLHGGNANH